MQRSGNCIGLDGHTGGQSGAMVKVVAGRDAIHESCFWRLTGIGLAAMGVGKSHVGVYPSTCLASVETKVAIHTSI